MSNDTGSNDNRFNDNKFNDNTSNDKGSNDTRSNDSRFNTTVSATMSSRRRIPDDKFTKMSSQKLVHENEFTINNNRGEYFSGVNIFQG